MNKKLKFMGLFLTMMITLIGCSSVSEEAIPETSIMETNVLSDLQLAYLEKVDATYSYNISNKLAEYKTNETLGYRPAGSSAELAAGDMLFEEMKSIGLQDVTKDEFTVDTWEFEKAILSFIDENGEEKNFELGGYQTQFVTNGPQEFELVYANKGTAADLEDLDVEGKLVLIDINQSDEWWINYPAYQAYLKGAAAIIAAQDGGYSEISPDALNAQDICGTADAPAFSITQNQAQQLKNLLKETENKTITVNFDAKSEVGFGGKTYNIVGSIPGKDPDSIVLMTAHYDAYFDGFQDDSAAIGLMMGIAKAIVESGYQPEKTLVFCALAAEEWGVSNTRYDWSTGAYNQIFKVRPDWAGKVVADINFELPAVEMNSTDYMRSVYEYNTFLSNFVNTVPLVDGAYADGVKVISPGSTLADDFSFAIGGVPSLRNDIIGDFMSEVYHTQFDNKDTYNEAVYVFHHNLYGLLMLEYDRVAVSPLNFATRLEALKESIDTQIMQDYDIDTTELLALIDKAIEDGNKVYTKVTKINEAYVKALDENNDEEASKLYNESRELNANLLSLFKYAEDNLVKLTWEDAYLFPHEHGQNNLLNIDASIDALENGDVKTALDEYLYAIDNNWYAYDFDQDVYNYFTDYVLNQPADRLMWGAGRVMGHENLFGTIKSLLEKYDTENPDVSKELETLRQAQKNQEQLLQEGIDIEIESIKEMSTQLSNLL